VRRAGGIPILIAPGEPRLGELLEILDGILLAGGGDVEASRYGEAPHAQTYGVDRARDDTDLALARASIDGGVPALCVCRGAQVLNVALGGTLIQHVPDVAGDTVQHRDGETPVPHGVRVDNGSRLAAILRAIEVSPASLHHQALARVAPGLEVVARAPDGVVEGVEMRTHLFLVGVQWHPEITAGKDPAQQRLFDELVREARAFRDRGRGAATARIGGTTR
jgi:putative glutamine amidotransferase